MEGMSSSPVARKIRRARAPRRKPYLFLSAVIMFSPLLLPAAARTGRTYYTDAKLALMRDNIEEYAWAREERAAIIAEADRRPGL